MKSVVLFFVLIHLLPLPFFLIGERFVKKEKRGHWWRRIAYRINHFFFRHSGINVDVPYEKLQHDQPVVFISNHPSMLDGFMYYSILGPDVTPLTEPTEEVMFPFNIWFAKMELVDVSRDDYDAHVAHKANTKKDALQKLVNILKEEKKSVLIFPEGHAEKKT